MSNITILRNVYAVDPKAGLDGVCDIVIDDGVICAVGEGAADAYADKGGESLRIIDCNGVTAMPGLIDMHTHLREPGQEYKEDIESGTRAARRGGFAAVACMPNTAPTVDNSAIVRSIVDKANKVGHVRVYPIGAISKGLEGRELAEMGDMKDVGIVAVSDDGHPVASSSLMKKALMYANSFKLPVISHCEDVDCVDDGMMNEGYNSTILGLRGIPWAAETNMVSRDIILAEYLGLPVHIAHVSARLSVELIRQAKARGVRVTCETCPHYFTLTDDAVLGFDTNAKVNPPLKTRDDVEAIIEGLCDGTIDVIATDHAPHHRDEKLVEFAQAANGIIGFETAFALSYTHLVASGRLSMADLVRKMSINPAEILSIGSYLAVGQRADITLVKLDEEYTIDVNKFVSKSRNSPFDGWRVKGRVCGVMIDGAFEEDIDI